MAENREKGLKIKFTTTRAALIVAMASIAVALLFYQYLVPKPITSVAYGNYILNFELDLREADKVPVYPSEEAINRELMHGLVQTVTIAFKPVDSAGNSLYSKESMQIIFNLRPGYLVRDLNPSFNAVNVTSYEYLPGKIQNPIIALVHPAYANETSVSVDGHVVTIKGRTSEELILATEKFLMAALGIEV
ncbi:hypothetical protein A3K63_04105 [Candidatus Micrarchaeota archaeon RBG_16_49_10]|nr:MAG: hypothetical protein A3K63_04105 [Candidatus Micrarchaeota archaeon RBG_16_49_10]